VTRPLEAFMHPYPHVYRVSVAAEAAGEVTLAGLDLPDMPLQAPPEFDGPPGYWSPETLFTAAVASCFVLSFRAVARASKLDWTRVSADADGVLERLEGVTRFTQVTVRARLVVPPGTDHARARMLMEKAEKVCLVSNSLNAARHLEAEVVEG
jgi:organic hydroperoxide reductase OsmC/OhrA